MSSKVEAQFSELINRPKDTVAKLATGRELLLHRRDAEDLVLTTATRAEQDNQVVSATTRMFVAMMRHDKQARALMLDVVPQAFPWVRFLPTEDRREFLVELVETLRAVDDIENPAPVVDLLAQWRNTAEVHADPELHAALTAGATDEGPVPTPPAS
ncbi:hypothetical protein [Saccharopolyspora flava]|uniref:Prevent-host-death family protein n=1 Tax=Saccharopolyspora flava TaxID=95161 RepID=A0A1I6PX93_9PSEU|nr:hypothetical protein [Saccharopolyspora flava]SFS44867.1 hypothetical protein SAMN05660874_01210 [Saccharopolyspora flava]